MQLSHKHWSLAFSTALLLHVAAAVGLFWPSPDPGVQAAGVGGIAVSLGIGAGPPGSLVAPAADVADATALSPTETADLVNATDEIDPTENFDRPTEDLPPEQVAELDDPATPVAADPTLSPPVEPVEVSVPEPTPVQALETIEPADTLPIEPEMTPVTAVDLLVADTPPVEPEPEPPPTETVRVEETPPDRIEPAETVVAQAVTRTPIPQVKPPPPRRSPEARETPSRARPAPPVRRRSTPPARAARPARAAAGARQIEPAGPAGGGGGSTTGGADVTGSGGDPGVRAAYMARLQAWLARHKEYPRRARQRRQEGTALLYFAIDRNGRLLGHRLRRSSGHQLLDREVIAMIKRAEPLPRIPAGMNQSRLELVIPVRFVLR